MFVAHGQCLESHGAGEAYMPVLEAIARLCKEDDTSLITELLYERAPTWMAQMPGLRGAGDRDGAQESLRGGTQDRMLREMVEVLEALAAKQALVLVLEDIHWSDPSTLDLVARLAMRTDAARLMVVATLRPADFRTHDQSLYNMIQTLVVRERAVEIALDVLNEESVSHYLERRFGQAALPSELAAVLHKRTNGHPLFMRNVVEHWVADGSLVDDQDSWRLAVDIDQLTHDLPVNLTQFIQQFFDELDPADGLVLSAAAIRGTEFTPVEVAAAVDQSAQEVESRCAALTRHGRWIRASGIMEWPDGAISSRFTFNHDLYQEVLYGLIPAGRLAELHRKMGDKLEAGYGADAADNAVELANHFVEGRVFDKAITYLRLAARQALRRLAPREAIDSLRRAIRLVPRLDDETERARQELVLQILLAPPLIAIDGVGSKDAEDAFVRARELCDILQEQVLYGMGAMYEVRGEFKRSQALMEERFKLPSLETDDLLQVETHELLACSLFHQGEFDQSLKQARDGMARFDGSRHSTMAPAFGENPGISCHFWAALSLWFQGQPNEALEELQRGLEMSADPDQHYSLATAYIQAATLHQLMRDVDGTIKWSELAEKAGIQQGYVLRTATGQLMQGWAVAIKGSTTDGIEKLKHGIDTAGITGACMDRPYFLGLLAEAYAAASRPDDGLPVIEQALVDIEERTHFFYAAELHRLRGILLLSSGTNDDHRNEARSALHKALDIAREQGAKSMELRAATSLSQFLRDHGEPKEAAALLAPLVASFSEAVDTPDLRDARQMMQTL
jgi:predicted ATPase